MKRAGLPALTLFFAVGMALAQNQDVEQQIKRMEKQLRSEIVKGETSGMEQFLAENYVSIGPAGETGKQQSIQMLKNGSVKYSSIEVKDEKVRVYGNTAIYNGLAAVKGTFNGRETSGDFRVTIVWVKQNGQWKRVSFQSTAVRPQGSE